MYTPYNSIQDKIIEIEQVSTIMLLLYITGYNNSIVCDNTIAELKCFAETSAVNV